MATHNELVAEGNKIDSALGTMQKIVMDRSTLPEQLKQVKANGTAKATRLTLIRTALDWDCVGCKHPKDRHTAGTAQCLAFDQLGEESVRCTCQEWHVDV